MDRYETRIEDGVLTLSGPTGSLEVGPMDAVVDVLGETYTLEYDEKQRAAAWLQTDDDGQITFDVRETVADLDFDDAFVERIADEPLDVETDAGHPRRTVAFAELLEEIWEARGNIEID